MHTIAEPIAPTPEGERATPIAIVGLACRFPDADDPLNLFESALAGRRSFRRLPPGRLGVAAADGQPPRAALLEGWQFSRAEFGVAETAYQAADPAHWLALETAGRALADAGFPGGQGLAGDRGRNSPGSCGSAMPASQTWPVPGCGPLPGAWPRPAGPMARHRGWTRLATRTGPGSGLGRSPWPARSRPSTACRTRSPSRWPPGPRATSAKPAVRRRVDTVPARTPARRMTSRPAAQRGRAAA